MLYKWEEKKKLKKKQPHTRRRAAAAPPPLTLLFITFQSPSFVSEHRALCSQEDILSLGGWVSAALLVSRLNGGDAFNPRSRRRQTVAGRAGVIAERTEEMCCFLPVKHKLVFSTSGIFHLLIQTDRVNYVSVIYETCWCHGSWLTVMDVCF